MLTPNTKAEAEPEQFNSISYHGIFERISVELNMSLPILPISSYILQTTSSDTILLIYMTKYVFIYICLFTNANRRCIQTLTKI